MRTEVVLLSFVNHESTSVWTCSTTIHTSNWYAFSPQCFIACSPDAALELHDSPWHKELKLEACRQSVIHLPRPLCMPLLCPHRRQKLHCFTLELAPYSMFLLASDPRASETSSGELSSQSTSVCQSLKLDMSSRNSPTPSSTSRSTESPTDENLTKNPKFDIQAHPVLSSARIPS